MNTCFQNWGQVFGVNNGPRLRTLGRPLSASLSSRFLLVFLAVALSLVFLPGVARGQASVTLEIGSPSPVTSLSFDLIDGPDVTPTVPAVPASFTVSVVTTNTSTWALEVNASQPYLDPISQLIPVGNVSWTASGSDFDSGTLSINPVTVAAGSGSGTFNGTLSFFLTNKWTYATGSYSDTITYTATSV